MGLISTEVEVSLCGANIKYYENLGYKIPRTKNKWGRITVPRYSKIMVNIEDVPKNSSVFVDVECDNCKNINHITYQRYNNQIHDGKNYCHSCACKILNSGENNRFWKSDKSEEERILGRDYQEYSNFIKRVLKRDNYTCQCCGMTDCRLVVHHLNGYDWCVDGRTKDSNGISLCDNCHKSFHSHYGYGSNTKEQFEEWLGYSILILESYNGELPTVRKLYDIEEERVYDSISEYCKVHKINDTGVYSCCNHSVRKVKRINRNGEISYRDLFSKTVKGHHLLWYDEYLKMSKEDLEEYIRQCENKSFIKTVCVSTGKCFHSMAEAGRYYKTSNVGIYHCCKGMAKSSGQLNGIRLQWMYLSDYEKLSQKEKDELLIKNIEMRE